MTDIFLVRFLLLWISTHTPLARRDQNIDSAISGVDEFLLTRLSRGVTIAVVILYNINMISTHTPLARRDAIVK